MNPMSQSPAALSLRFWGAPGDAPGGYDLGRSSKLRPLASFSCALAHGKSDYPCGEPPVFLRDALSLPAELQSAIVALDQGSVEYADELLARGAQQVLLAASASTDSDAVARLVQRYGSGRIGIWAAVRRMPVVWTLDGDSNADFKCMSTSIGTPCWETLQGGDTGTGTEVEVWLQPLLAAGASMALIALDVEADDDLALCAHYTERYGERVWFTPRLYPDADLQPWIRYGQVRQLVLPAAARQAHEKIERLFAAAGAPQEVMA